MKQKKAFHALRTRIARAWAIKEPSPIRRRNLRSFGRTGPESQNLKKSQFLTKMGEEPFYLYYIEVVLYQTAMIPKDDP